MPIRSEVMCWDHRVLLFLRCIYTGTNLFEEDHIPFPKDL